MKLNRTREEWAKIKADGRWYSQSEKMALEDLTALFAEVERLRGALADIADNEDQFSMTWAAKLARQALGDTHD